MRHETHTAHVSDVWASASGIAESRQCSVFSLEAQFNGRRPGSAETIFTGSALTASDKAAVESSGCRGWVWPSSWSSSANTHNGTWSDRMTATIYTSLPRKSKKIKYLEGGKKEVGREKKFSQIWQQSDKVWPLLLSILVRQRLLRRKMLPGLRVWLKVNLWSPPISAGGRHFPHSFGTIIFHPTNKIQMTKIILTIIPMKPSLMAAMNLGNQLQ